MKILLLFLTALVFSACDSVVKPAEPTPSPTPIPTPTPVPTPKPGDWRLKDYKNPLDQKPHK